MLSTIGMNASRAQCSRYIVAATASTVRATLRMLTFDSILELCVRPASPRDPIRRMGSATSAFRAQRQTRARLQRLVDRDTRLRALGGRDDGKLHVAGGVANDVHAGNARFAPVIGLDRSLTSELAAEALREVGLLRLRRVDEYSPARQWLAAVEHQPRRAALLVLEPEHPLRADNDLVGRELVALRSCRPRAVRAQRHARAPRFHRQRESHGSPAAPDHRQ